MSFFISEAWAEAAPAAASHEPNLVAQLLPLLALFAVFYFLLIRPQSKRAKEHKKMVEALSKGDEIVTVGGMYGKIVSVGDNAVTVEVADNVQLILERQSIGKVMPKGTLKGLK